MILASYYIVDQWNFEDRRWANVYFIISGMALIINTAKFLTRKKLILTNSELIFEKSILGYKWNEKFRIKLIKEPKSLKRVSSGISTSNGHFRILGVEVGRNEETMYYHPEILSFEYQGKTFEFGHWIKAFGAPDFVQEIKRRQ
jgi:hypothetical protein